MHFIRTEIIASFVYQKERLGYNVRHVCAYIGCLYYSLHLFASYKTFVTHCGKYIGPSYACAYMHEQGQVAGFIKEGNYWQAIY